jgi:hypothetical protein
LRLKDGDRVLLLTHVRYHYVNFADHSFEFALSLPLARGFSVNLGTSYQFGRHDDEKRVALKLTREFKRGSILHVGLELRERPAFLAGITVPL